MTPPDSYSPPAAPATWLAPLGGWCAHHAKAVVAAWLVVFVLAGVGAVRLPAVLSAGSGDIPESASLRTSVLLRTEFANPFAQLLVLAMRSSSLAGAPEERAGLILALERRLREMPAVGGVMFAENLVDARLHPRRGSGDVFYLGLNAGSVREAEQAVPVLRAAIAPLLREAKARHPDLEWALTGRAALTYDLNQFNAADTTTAELRVLPLTVAVLVFAFGSLVAAGVPLLLGLLSTTVSLGVVYLLAQIAPFSNLVQNVASMIGLAVGIDYSLLLIHRFREELRHPTGGTGASQFHATRGDRGWAGRSAHGCGEVVSVRSQPPAERPAHLGQERHESEIRAEQPIPAEVRRQALVTTLGTAGASVFFSGLTVLIGMGGLLLTPLMETRAVGLGGCVVVAVAVVASLTLVPALLSLLGHTLEWPAVLSRRLHTAGERRRWEAWAAGVMRFPVAAAGLSLALLLLLAWPGVYTRFGFSEEALVPRELEFRRGLDLLRGMGLAGQLAPVQVVLTAEDAGPAFTRGRIPALLAFSTRLRADSRVASIHGLVDLEDGLPAAHYTELYADPDAALAAAPYLRDLFVSRDQRRMLLQVVLRPDCDLEEAKALVREIPGWLQVPGLRLDLGGQAVYYNDFDAAMKRAYARSVGFVLGATFLVLLLVFRAPLVAGKAILLNLLSVLAGYGVTVFVFQLGHGASWFGVAVPVGMVPLTIPLLIFCILFGLSMDYEVFLLSRAREGWLQTGNSREAVRAALADTGPVITSAALIMVAVFGAFAFARMVMVQMLGLGLAVAVLVDATLIRVLLAPALMQVAGRWNWWPSTPAILFSGDPIGAQGKPRINLCPAETVPSSTRPLNSNG